MSLIFRLNAAHFLKFKWQSKINGCQKISTTPPKRDLLDNRLRRIGSSTEKERAFKINDKIPNEYELIYRATIGYYLTAAKYCVIFSTTAVVGLAAWHLFSQGNLIPTPVPEMVYGGLVAKDSDLIYFACGFVAINILFSGIVRRYPLRIYKNVDKYIAIYESTLPFRGVQHHYFKKGEVAETKALLETWRDCYFRLGNRNSLLFSYYFKTPSEFNQMF